MVAQEITAFLDDNEIQYCSYRKRDHTVILIVGGRGLSKSMDKVFRRHFRYKYELWEQLEAIEILDDGISAWGSHLCIRVKDEHQGSCCDRDR